MKEERISKKEQKLLRRQDRENQKTQEGLKKKKSRYIGLAITLILVALFFAFISWLVENRPEQDIIQDETPSEINAISESDQVKWASEEDALVTIIEYSDFQCPACGAYYSMINQLAPEFEDSVRFVYRHFPLSNIHFNARLAAQSAEAAGLQGKFWEMHDIIFENQELWSNAHNTRSIFLDYARDLELDISQFEDDLESDEVKSRVEEGVIDGSGANVNSTPTFFVNGEKIVNPRTYAEFQQLIQSEIDLSIQTQ